MPIPWRQYPLLRLVFPAIAGILSYHSGFRPPLNFPVSVVVMTMLLVAGVWLHRSGRDTAFGYLIQLSSLLLFFSLCWFTDVRNDPRFIGLLEDPDHLVLTLNEGPDQRGRWIVYPASVSAAGGRKLEPVKGKILLYLSSELPGADTLLPGDEILIRGSIIPVRSAVNPVQFDYSAYLATMGIYHQVYSEEPWRSIGSKYTLRRMAWIIRSAFVHRLNRSLEPRHAAIASALLTGYKEGLDRETMNHFSATGTMHVLAVSGLHVGVIYMLILFLTQKLYWLKQRPYFITLIVILCVWFFALFTGLSASVSRAAFMLSVIALSRSIKRQAPVINTLAAAALVLLVSNPLSFYNIGFQLSFVAVGGIVIIQPVIRNLFQTGNRVLAAIVDLLSVSVAAQLATFPLGLFYFHQFPNYFLPANMIIVPLCSLIIYTGVLFAAVTPFGPATEIVGWLLQHQLDLLLFLVEFFQRLPYAVSTGIYTDIPETILIYMAVACGLGLLAMPTVKKVLAVLISLNFLMMWNTLNYSLIFNTGQLIVLYWRGETALYSRAGSTVTVSATQGLQNKSQFGRLLEELNNYYHVREMKVNYYETVCGTAGEGSLKINVPCRNNTASFCGELVLITEQNAKTFLKTGYDCLPDRILIDGSCTYRFRNYTIKKCELLKIPYTDLSGHGAVILSARRL